MAGAREKVKAQPRPQKDGVARGGTTIGKSLISAPRQDHSSPSRTHEATATTIVQCGEGRLHTFWASTHLGSRSKLSVTLMGADVEEDTDLIKRLVREDSSQKDEFEAAYYYLVPTEDRTGGFACASTSTNSAFATGLNFIKNIYYPPLRLRASVHSPLVCPHQHPPRASPRALNCLDVTHLYLQFTCAGDLASCTGDTPPSYPTSAALPALPSRLERIGHPPAPSPHDHDYGRDYDCNHYPTIRFITTTTHFLTVTATTTTITTAPHFPTSSDTS